ncbi:MAG: 5-oxoprolinase subunit PxpB [Anaerobacillus sp.]
MSISFDPLGEAALKLSFNRRISPLLNNNIVSFCEELASRHINGITEWVPAYDSVTVYYEPWAFTYKQITELLSELVAETDQQENHIRSVVTIPTLYGGEFGPDLENLAHSKGKKKNDIIALHTERDYLVNMIGFLPGFPYLSGLNEEIAMPRLDEPRQAVPAGSVGIAGNQTGIYPLESPGGWNVIGRTPLRLFDPEKKEPFLFQQGDFLHFQSITEEEYKRIQLQVEDDTYELERREGNE